VINPELNQKSVLTLPPWEAARFPRYIFSEFLMYKFQVNDMTCGARDLKEVVAEQALELRILKKA
jgi:hypothetical protein